MKKSNVVSANFQKSGSSRFVALSAALVIVVAGYFLATSRASAVISAFSSSTVPTTITDPDKVAVELGVKFRVDTPGQITGVRYYKGAKNTGSHVGSLWTDKGVKLASATFANESASGWQEVTFANPVAVSAGTTYVASYFAPNGQYSVDEDYFANKSVDNGALHLLKNGTDGPNGLYKYGPSSFPTESYRSSNYYVDVLFTPTSPTAPTPDTAAPTTILTAPANNASLSGSIDVTATATDNIGVTKVEFLVDDAVKSTDASAPYSFNWNTATVNNGAHKVIARAYDLAGNKGDSTVANVTVSNTTTTPTPPVPTTETATFTPTDDATIRSSAPNRNSGADSVLSAATGPDRHYLLKFKTTGLAGKTIKSAKLRLYVVDSSSNGGDIHRLSSDDWSEGAVNWNNVPDSLPSHVGGFGAVSSGRYVETELNNVVTGDGTISLLGDGTISNVAGYSSKEAGTNPPQLVVTYTSPTTTGPDTTAPTAPTNLTAKADSPTQVSLTWGASNDELGVAKYLLYRGTTLIAQPTGTTYVDNTVSANTSYSYTVKAQDAAGNTSPASGAATITTPQPTDSTQPTAPGSLRATSTTATQVALAWNASTDNSSVARYLVYRGSTLLAQVTGTSFTDNTVAPSTSYSYTVKAQDAAGNIGDASNTLSVTTPAQADTTAPSVPGTLAATAASPTRTNLTWSASTDNVGVANYLVYRGGTLLAQVTTTSYSDTTAVAGTSYSYTVRAQDAAGNTSNASSAANVTMPSPPDTTAPSVPGNLAATAPSANQVNLTWSASTDNVGVAIYDIYRGSTLLASTPLTNYGDVTVASNTAYTYTVRAKDAAGNQSTPSNAVNVTTPGTSSPIGMQLWSSPATWGGSVPKAGDTVTIAKGTKILLDVDAPKLKGLTINGELHFADRNTNFRSGYIAVYGLLQMGTDVQPLVSDITITLDGAQSDVLTANGLAVGANVMVVVGGGRAEIHGKESGNQWSPLETTANAGSTSITLREPVSWQAGDKIVLSSSDLDYAKYDEATVASRSADGRTINLSAPLKYKHAAVVTSFTVGGETRSTEERAEAGLLTHNIKFTGPDDSASTRFGGHTMVLSGSTMRISNAEFVRMGQIGVLGRYPMHWHLTGNAASSDVRNVSSHQSFNRFLTIHQTNNLHINGFVGHNTFGHGIMLEDGLERFNVMNDMLVMTIKRPANSQMLRASDDVPSEFWLTHPTNDVTNSSAAGGEGAGIWHDYNFNSDNTNIFEAINEPIGKMENLVAHSHVGYHSRVNDGGNDFANEASGGGIVIEGLYGVPENRAQLRNFNAWKNERFGLWLDGAYTVNGIYGANNNVAYNGQDTAATGGLLAGSTANTGSEEGNVGGLIRFYHGQADVDNVWVANYDMVSGSFPDKTAISDSGASSTNATNRVRRIKFLEPPSVPRVLHASNSSYFNANEVSRTHWFQDLDGSVKEDGVSAYIHNREAFVKSSTDQILYPKVSGRGFLDNPDLGAYNAGISGIVNILQYNGLQTFTMTNLTTGFKATQTLSPGVLLKNRYRIDNPASSVELQIRGSDPGWFDVVLPNSNEPNATNMKISGGGLSGPIVKVASEAALGEGGTYFYNSSTREVIVRIQIKGTPIPFLNGGDYRTIRGDWAEWRIR